MSRLWVAASPLLAMRQSCRRRSAQFRSAGAEFLESRLLLTVFQNFDGVTAPALPSGWTTSTTGTVTNAWVTVNGGSVSTPNRVFIPDVTQVSDTSLTSPQFLLAATNRRLIFDQSFNLDFDGTQYFDGGVLEISVAGGGFQDIIAAGGSFVSGGYVGPISPGGDTPLPNRQAWSGDSNGFLTTIVDLPASAIGQNVRLRWRLATDNVVGLDGWSIDSIRLTDTSVAVNSINETFDFVTAPALPAGWSQAAQGLFPQLWGTVAGGAAGGANRAFVADLAHTPGGSANNPYDSQLTAPKLLVSQINRRLTFRQSFDLEFSGSSYYDGGVLEVAVDGGDFVDILAAGGTFVTGGYNHSIYPTSDNPMEGRSAWTANSNGYITTTVDLPTTMIGKTVQYRWRFGADNEGGQVGWSIDSVQTADPDPDDQISEAFPVSLNSSTTANLENGSDVDLFAFDVAASQTIKFDVDAIGAGGLSDALLRIFDASGNELAASDDDAGPAPEGTSGKESFISFTFTTGGRYYAGVSGFNNQSYNATTGAGDSTSTHTGSYTLHIGPAPTVAITMADSALTLGETSLVTFTFSEPVTGFANADVTVENGMLSTVSTANGGLTFTATLTPNPNISDATNLITVNNSGYTDAVGNPGTGTSSSQNYTVNTANFTDILLSNFIVNENLPSTVIGNLSAAGGPGGTATFSIDPGNDGGLFTIVGDELRVGATGLDFEALTSGQAIVNLRVTAAAVLDFQKTLTIQVVNVNDAPVLNNPAGTATFNKLLKLPAQVFSQWTVTDQDVPPNLGGGTLALTVNVASNPKGNKFFDTFDLPGISIIGTGTPQFGNGQLTLQIQLATDTSAGAIQAFLRGITFSTKGSGLRSLTRTASVVLTDVGGLSTTLNQTINVRKK